MLKRHSSSILFVTLASLSACGDEASCPQGTKRVDGVCIDISPSSQGSDSTCYLDQDRDGFGAGEPVSCDVAPDPSSNEIGGLDAGEDAGGADAGSMTRAPAVVAKDGDCDDQDPTTAPTFKELCDAIDNDCNGMADDDASNACGGDCSLVLPHAPDEACDNGLLGACKQAGTYVCDGKGAVRCNAPTAMPSPERCGDTIDNDCDGHVDESDASDAAIWYRDCDGDGYAASVLGSLKACAKPSAVDGCEWTKVAPNASSKTDLDCDDTKPEYSPKATFSFPPNGSTNWDLNCDGKATPIPNSFGFHLTKIKVCDVDIVERLNAATDHDFGCADSLAAQSVGCIVWKGTRGQYDGAPTSKCPDTKTFALERRELRGPSDTSIKIYLCRAKPVGPAWPCN